MRRFIILFSTIAFILLTGAGTHVALSQTKPDGDKPRFAEDRVLVKLKEGVPEDTVEAINRKNNARTEKKIPRTRVSVVKLPKGLQVADAVKRYEASPDVEYAEPDFLFAPAQITPKTPNDPEYRKMWNLDNTGQTGGTADADTDEPEAWGTTTGATGTVVAVIDTGVDINHPDLNDNVWTNPDETPGNGVDDDRNGYVDDIHGWDFVDENSSVFDSATDDSHGTHVAGTIGAEGNNSIGITGVNWQTKIMPLKFIGSSRFGYGSDFVEALNYAVAEGITISNNSWAGSSYSQTIMDAIKRADAAGHLIVAGAANGGSDSVGDNNDVTPMYPASYDSPNVIAVAASDRNDALASFSNYGATSVDLAAPGTDILSTVPGGTYGYKSGTSMATPHVSGIAALLKSKEPTLDAAGMKDRILRYAEKKEGLSGKVATGGRANAYQSLNSTLISDQAPAPAPVYSPPPNYAAPVIGGMRPANGSTTRDRTPAIGAVVRDSQAELNKGNMSLFIDGKRITTFRYNAGTDRLTYTSKTLSYGRHTVKIVANDGQLSVSRSWRFKVAS